MILNRVALIPAFAITFRSAFSVSLSGNALKRWSERFPGILLLKEYFLIIQATVRSIV